jgi:hypothetical protein
MCLKKTNGGGGGGGGGCGGSQLSVLRQLHHFVFCSYVYFSLALKFGWKGTKVLNNLDGFGMD